MPRMQLPEKLIVPAVDALTDMVDRDMIDQVAGLMGFNPEDIESKARRKALDQVFRYFNTRGRIVDLLGKFADRDPALRAPTELIIANLSDPIAKLAASLDRQTVAVVGRGHTTLSYGEGKQGWLQRLVRKTPKSIDHATLLMRMIDVGQRVCLVERYIGEGLGLPMGTGFLIAPDLVLTNHHVVRKVLSNEVPATALRCRFDFQRDSTGTVVAEGTALALAAGSGWLVDDSPFAPGDDKPGAREATGDELDYAVLRLSRPAGADDAAIPGTAVTRPRGWYDIDAASVAPVAGDEVVVAGHAKGLPLVHAIGETQCYAAADRRLRHDAYTLPGSSGSPVFDSDYRLVALHQSGDPDFDHDAAYNQAIPIPLIAARSKAKRGAVRNGG